MLDKNRHYIRIVGETEYGHAFEQDGIMYDAAGKPCKKQTKDGAKALRAKMKELEQSLKDAEDAISGEGAGDDGSAESEEAGKG